MTAQVIQLTIPSKRQDNLAALIDRLARQNEQAAMRKAIYEIIEAHESVILKHEQVIFYAKTLLAQMDGGPDAA